MIDDSRLTVPPVVLSVQFVRFVDGQVEAAVGKPFLQVSRSMQGLDLPASW
jgi:hypothetical protein